MNFRELSYITVVADCQNITKAAQKLYVSQPSLSHLISKVEDEIGLKLFDRTAYPLTLTYAGERYVETARQILRLSDNLTKEFMDISHGLAGRIVVGMPTERVGYMLPRILSVFKKEYPGIEVIPFEGKGEILLEGVLKGQCSIVIMPLGTNRQDFPSDLASEKVYQEELTLVTEAGFVKPELCVKGHPDCIDPEKLQTEDFQYILSRKGHILRAMTDHILNQYLIRPGHIIESSSTITAFNLAVSGDGVAFVPQRTIEMANKIHPYQSFHVGREGFYWDIVALYRKDAYLDQAERRFIEIAKELFQ